MAAKRGGECEQLGSLFVNWCVFEGEINASLEEEVVLQMALCNEASIREKWVIEVSPQAFAFLEGGVLETFL